ncbi:MAG TPA: NAD-dependent epimerase/dehydratase family protein [Longimicrobiales bacterium]|nr:NAD-dependent epimerase/dehydratase family protein [Longimicrobiales bacterium]
MASRILVTGAAGQIGSELVPALRAAFGEDEVIATDIKDAPAELVQAGPWQSLDCTDSDVVAEAVSTHRVGVIYHLAALLSAVAEHKPALAFEVNLGGLYNVLEVAREARCAVFTPSSIAAFGPETPPDPTPQVTIQRPTTMYGVTKVAGELLCDYYHTRFGVDTRGLRYPGLVSYVTAPGGGTTDWAVDIFRSAVRDGTYTCFLAEGTQLDMMYMPDALRAAMELMSADASRLVHRNAFNVTAMQLTPERLAAAIAEYVPGFSIEYDVDSVRQGIAESWPRRIDDTAAREEWGWRPEYDMNAMTRDMIEKLLARQPTI